MIKSGKTTIIKSILNIVNQDQQITAVIVNRKENLLKKGGGYHLDLLVVAIGIIVNSLLGIPWYNSIHLGKPGKHCKTYTFRYVASTILSVTHVQVKAEKPLKGSKKF